MERCVSAEATDLQCLGHQWYLGCVLLRGVSQRNGYDLGWTSQKAFPSASGTVTLVERESEKLEW